MSENPFSNPALSMLSSQMAQAWQSSLEAWWNSILSDSGKLGDLARRLAETSPLGSARSGGASSEDVARLVDALELMEGRISRMEAELQDLKGSLAEVVSYLERLSDASPASKNASAGKEQPED